MAKKSVEHVLVTGGAGFIGSHVVVRLLEKGLAVTVLDDFSNSSPEVIKRVQKITGKKVSLVKGDVRDKKLVKKIFHSNKFAGVIHLAALKAVDESIEKPAEYYDVNVGGTAAIVAAARAAGVTRLVYSSSATVYKPKNTPISESAPLGANNPYGETKIICEKMLVWEAAAHPWSTAILRYFNPVGAHPSGLIGEDPRAAANIAPALLNTLIGTQSAFKLFGDDYKTKDHTAVRDYIHIMDLADAHITAWQETKKFSGVAIYNVGTGRGYSVREMINAFAQASGKKISVNVQPRRPGDLAYVVADVRAIARNWKWRATRNLQDMAASAWLWRQKNPRGYRS